MKITRPQEAKAIFESLENGNVFTSDRSGNTFTYMKIKATLGGRYNAIDLEDGRPTHFEDTEFITPYWDAYITLE